MQTVVVLVLVIAAGILVASEPVKDPRKNLDGLKKKKFYVAYDTKFMLYTRSNPTQPQQIVVTHMAYNTLRKTNFNVKHPTRLLIHDFLDDAKATLNVLGARAYLSRYDLNIIVVDWGACAQQEHYCVQEVGMEVARFLDWLNFAGELPFSAMSLIGHALGAHVAGIAGKHVTRGRLASIVGLDATSFGYSYNESEKRLSSTDAEYVENVHTSTTSGFVHPIGVADFYMNWGRNQPRCESDGLFDELHCGVNSSVVYFVESIYRPDAFWGTRCDGYDSIEHENCPPSGVGVAMGGEPIVPKPEGVYYVPTNSKMPYGRGKPV